MRTLLSGVKTTLDDYITTEGVNSRVTGRDRGGVISYRLSSIIVISIPTYDEMFVLNWITWMRFEVDEQILVWS